MIEGMTPIITTLGADGLLPLPKEVCKSLGIEPGTQIAITIENGQITLQTLCSYMVNRLCGITAGGPSMCDELIADRRREDRVFEDRYEAWAKKKPVQ